MPKISKTSSSSKSATSGKKSKKTKDPNAPKKNLSAYLLFAAEIRSEIKSDNPGMSPKEILSEIGAQWKASDAATKHRFQKLADAEKAEYTEKMAAYNSEKNDKESAEKENKKKKQKKATDEQSSKNEHMEEDPNESFEE